MEERILPFFRPIYKHESRSTLASLPVASQHLSFLFIPCLSILYFAYGSNMNLDQMAMRCPGAELGPVARLTRLEILYQWRWLCRDCASRKLLRCWAACGPCRRNTGKPSIITKGVAGGYYERLEMDLELLGDQSTVRCWVYLSCNYEYGVPTDRYQQVVVEGARQVSLPENYLPILESWAHGCPQK
jgi:hypothetical protein